MTTELLFRDKKIPVSFISSDQKAIPQLISVLESKHARSATAGQSELNDISRIEIIGNHAILHRSQSEDSIQMPLY
ncbi:hypothetical protein [Paenibacillus cremeus]|uniref:Uncharacterized protein n=1 Tax=Paenibacillus cremeus TaxID=2163881 RepID=A0A559K3K8_9BACL|nr:hypothetical protein [Paenibacillus cremeus]TVY06718.1 hypothetical protein FPZ49_27555 [Paenibacillus cremeus]